MKDFEQLDVFIPDDPVSKDRMKLVYNIFAAMITDLAGKLERQEGNPWVAMMDYVPDEWIELAQYYALKFYYEEKAEILYLVLVYVSHSETDQSNDMPLVFLNVSGNKILSLDCDCAAYTMMVTFLNHLGMTSNLMKESAEHELPEGS